MQPLGPRPPPPCVRPFCLLGRRPRVNVFRDERWSRPLTFACLAAQLSQKLSVQLTHDGCYLLAALSCHDSFHTIQRSTRSATGHSTVMPRLQQLMIITAITTTMKKRPERRKHCRFGLGVF